MTDKPTNSQEDYDAIEYVVTVRRPGIWRRLGCAAGLIGWVVFLSIPLLLIVLAVRGQITVPRGGDIPNHETYPRLQVWLVMEMDYRGLNITSTMVDRDGGDALCVQTNVRFVLWEGEGEAATYCECYARESRDAPWDVVEAAEGPCP